MSESLFSLPDGSLSGENAHSSSDRILVPDRIDEYGTTETILEECAQTLNGLRDGVIAYQSQVIYKQNCLKLLLNDPIFESMALWQDERHRQTLQTLQKVGKSADSIVELMLKYQVDIVLSNINLHLSIHKGIARDASQKHKRQVARLQTQIVGLKANIADRELRNEGLLETRAILIYA
ncbi:hypothetical protein TSTA_090780 [Talaromyces stipitatus ATCC 10500]|uniref:Uncharacterized protein n=1 Tax=Talaromyces stipitatus (strain ATCC 10500 / CBS 375.48 / QM 6759 / NRRL 1006) TaxID=441959 RepID=B8M1E2_TALSN|nr:uncharacterized protein TSTA_090780 [Talaromyces stipitatus ATCC 10500]EED21838.1 hypothetical protein TSTA_090780 [Talaromyces stipitatus ATCC 10500]